MGVKLTRNQIESRKEKAVRFVRDVLGDSDRADEIESESTDAYAARRRIAISIPEDEWLWQRRRKRERN